ncbi:NosD domain-containing protein [Caldisphaera sp.]|uniref:NosD domain-containing protein n=1 Tax=Caldisphaera sp. TaxID=2060322 RepID=UPI003D0EBAE9
MLYNVNNSFISNIITNNEYLYSINLRGDNDTVSGIIEFSKSNMGNIYITGNYNTIENILIKYNNQGGFYINDNYEISDNDTIQGVFIVDNLYGVFGAFINDSSINSVAVINDSSGTFSENGVGFVIGGNHNILENLTAKDNGYGMSLGGIDNILTDSIIENNSHYGLILSHSQGDLIYNNIFNNTNNLDIILS